MKVLTANQKNFLLETFFVNERLPGSKGIGEKLLETGKCIVAGQGEPIWVGGIGNFIKTEPSEEGVNCTLYTFDLDNFLSSAWYKEVQDNHLISLYNKKVAAQKEYEEISNLV